MNERIKRKLSQFRDGELEPEQVEALRLALRESDDLAALEAEYREIGEWLRDQPILGGATPEAAWQDVQRAIRLGENRRRPGVDWILGSPLRWGTGMVSLVAAGLGLGLLFNQDSAVAALPPTEVEWVDTAIPGASTMVYRDEETGLTVIWIMEEDQKKNGNASS